MPAPAVRCRAEVRGSTMYPGRRRAADWSSKHVCWQAFNTIWGQRVRRHGLGRSRRIVSSRREPVASRLRMGANDSSRTIRGDLLAIDRNRPAGKRHAGAARESFSTPHPPAGYFCLNGPARFRTIRGKRNDCARAVGRRRYPHVELHVFRAGMSDVWPEPGGAGRVFGSRSDLSALSRPLHGLRSCHGSGTLGGGVDVVESRRSALGAHAVSEGRQLIIISGLSCLDRSVVAALMCGSDECRPSPFLRSDAPL